jgi:hypothetical protein
MVHSNVRAMDTGLANSDNGYVLIPTSGARYATVQCEIAPSGTGAGTWASASLSLQRGNNANGPFYALESPVTITAPGITAAVDLKGFAYLVLFVGTAEAGLYLNVYTSLSNAPA